MALEIQELHDPRRQAMYIPRAWGLPRGNCCEIKNEEWDLRGVISPRPSANSRLDLCQEADDAIV